MANLKKYMQIQGLLTKYLEKVYLNSKQSCIFAAEKLIIKQFSPTQHG